MAILDQNGNPLGGRADPVTCDHGVTFDYDEAKKILAGFVPKDAVEFIVGNPATAEVRKRWPRLFGVCPRGCGYNGIAYASYEHYLSGDW